MISKNIVLDDSAFTAASADMASLVTRTTELRDTLKALYEDLQKALDTPAGHQINFTATNVLLQPINDLLAVIKHTSETLNQIIGTGYYKDVFVKFEDLNTSIK